MSQEIPSVVNANASIPPSGGIVITLKDTGKRFNRDWIFRHVDFSFRSGCSYAITGPNGSGKSTLLQTIAGSITPTEGTILYEINSRRSDGKLVRASSAGAHETIDTDNIYEHVSIAAPYLEVIEEMTAMEFLRFHASFKPMIAGLSFSDMLQTVGLHESAEKQIRFFSSGMKQRIKLAQAIFSAVEIILLDEPCTNLDAAGYSLYHRLVDRYCKDKLVIVSSNDVNEYDFCAERISILDYK